MLHLVKRALWMSLLRLGTLLPVCWTLLLVSVSPLKAQDPNTILAVTPCEGRSVATFINLILLGTDSAKEILTHEAVHREQANRSIRQLGHCPFYSDHRLLLEHEVEAYCVSSVERVKRTHDEEENNYSTVQRLRNQFQEMPTDSLVAAWQRGCPRYAFPHRREVHRRDSGRDRLVTGQSFCASDSDCPQWRPYVRIGDAPLGPIYIAFGGSAEACIIDGMMSARLRPGDRLQCDWRVPSGRN